MSISIVNLTGVTAIALCFLGTACGTEVEPVPDGCTTHDQASFELGTGASGFEPIEDGQDLKMATGNQGGCHFWLSVRTDGFAERGFSIRYEVFDAATGESTGSSSNFRVRLDTRPGTDGLCEFVGLTGFLIEPWTFEDQSVRIDVMVTDNEGRTAEQSKTVVARWPDVPTGADRDTICGPRG